MADWPRRLRALLDKQFPVFIAILVVLALLGGWLTYTTHAQPSTTTEERPGPSWETEGQFNHSPTVTEPNSIYPIGTTLHNRSIYFTRITPWLNGTYTFTYRASDSGSLDGTVVLQLVLQGVEENQNQRTIVWRRTEELETAEETLEPGEQIRVPFSVNMNETINETEIIEEELDNPPGQPEALVTATVDLNGTVNGRSVDRVKNHTLRIALEQSAYEPRPVGNMTAQYQRTRTVTVEQTYGPLRSVGAPLLLVLSLLGLGGLAIARHQDRIGLTDSEREFLRYRDDREDFDEWISEIRLPEEAFDLPRASASSLGALVDFAIDTDNSVVEDPDDDAYYVVHDGYLYTYRPPDLPSGGGPAPETDDDEPPDSPTEAVVADAVEAIAPDDGPDTPDEIQADDDIDGGASPPTG